jgi:hypothetical protein
MEAEENRSSQRGSRLERGKVGGGKTGGKGLLRLSRVLLKRRGFFPGRLLRRMAGMDSNLHAPSCWAVLLQLRPPVPELPDEQRQQGGVEAVQWPFEERRTRAPQGDPPP